MPNPYNCVRLMQSKRFHSGLEYRYPWAPVEWKGTNYGGRYKGRITFEVNPSVSVEHWEEFSFELWQ